MEPLFYRLCTTLPSHIIPFVLFWHFPWRNAYLTGAQELRQGGVTVNAASGGSKNVQRSDADAIWRMPKAALFALLQSNTDGMRQAAQLQGGEKLLDTVCEHVVIFTPDFTIIEP